MNYFNGDGYGNGCAFVFMVIFGVFLYGFSKLAIWIAKPSEFVVNKDMIPTKRIVTDGVKVDTVLVYRFNK
jgi:hypothetical protein